MAEPHRGRRLRVRRADVPARAERAGRQTAIHGLVRWASWRAVERDEARVVLEHVLHPQPGLSVHAAHAGRVPPRPPTASRCGRPPRTSARPRARSAAATIRTSRRARPRSTTSSLRIPGREPERLGSTVLDTTFTDLERDADGRWRLHAGGVTVWADEAWPYVHPLHRRPAAGRGAAQPRRRADDLPAAGLPHRRGPDPPRARRRLRGHVGDRRPAAPVGGMAKKRLDVLLVERGLAESRAQAQALVMAGLVPGYDKPGQQVDEAAELERRARARRTSRAAARSSRTRSTRSASTRPGSTASTSARRRAASPTSCSSAAPRA